MDHIKNLLSSRIRQSGLSRQVGSAMIIAEAKKILYSELGELASKRVRPLYFKNGILNIACLSSVMTQEISLKKQGIIDRLNKKLGAEFVKDIRLII